MFTVLEPEEAVREDAPVFAFSFLTSDARLVGADSRTGICEALIEGYDSLEVPADDPGFDPWLDARTEALGVLAGAIQAALLADVEKNNPEEFASLSEDELTALLHPKLGAVLEFDDWKRPDVPLILVATNYVPFNLDVIAPEGDGIIWVDSHNERTFIESLSKLGLGQLFINEQKLEEVTFALEEQMSVDPI